MLTLIFNGPPSPTPQPFLGQRREREERPRPARRGDAVREDRDLEDVAEILVRLLCLR